MKKVWLTLALLFFVTFVSAHGGEDPLKELQKNKSKLSSVQTEFKQLSNQQDRIESLESQVIYLQENILILRRLMAKDYPHVTTGMSKYKLNYIAEIENGLEEFKLTLEQMKTAIEI